MATFRAYFKTPGIADFGLSIADYVVGQSAIRNPQFAIWGGVVWVADGVGI
jgi:hypothetical protein